jgi:hypothetical protein
MIKDIFESAVRSKGDLAGVFEYDGETGYFYLYDVDAPKVIDHLHISSGPIDYTGKDVAILWDYSEEMVGLFIRNILWALFDWQRMTKHGGNYKRGKTPDIPPEVSFSPRQ